MDLWNSIEAQKIRSGILDGSFSHCDCDVCPMIVARTLPLRKEISGQFGEVISSGLTVLPRGPECVKLAHDDTCNLSCPSCRRGRIVAGGKRQAELDRILHEFILPFLRDTKMLELSGDGDPFASRHYRAILRETARTNPAMKIGLHTNGVLCDENAWAECSLAGRVSRVEVSIDAASADTYAVVRRGGNFERLLENLAFLAELRSGGSIELLKLSFVVQQLNFHEMPDFVRLGQRFNADQVYFSLIRHWWDRAMTAKEFAQAQVWRRNHPQYREFVSVLKNKALREKLVDLGNVRPQKSWWQGNLRKQLSRSRNLAGRLITHAARRAAIRRARA